MSEIKVHVLNNKEFDGLGPESTKGSDISDSLGFANPEKQEVFVRETGSHELNKYLINHELEELVGEGHPGHEDENGIRHKKFFKEVVAPLFTGVNLETKKFSPLGAFDPSITSTTRDKKRVATEEAEASNKQLQQSFNPSGALGQFSVQGGGAPFSQNQPGASSVAGGFSTGVNQQGLGGGLNQPQQLSPELLQRTKGFFAGRPSF